MSRLLRRILFSLIAAFLAGACTDDVDSPTGIGVEEPALATSDCVLDGGAELVVSRISYMRQQVERFESLGLINAGQARALGNHLANALRSLEEGQFCAVRAQLEAFRSQLEELVDVEGISDREAHDLRHAIRLALTEQTYQSGDPEEYAPGATGELRTVHFEGEELRVMVIDGLAIFNGDIILGFVDELEAGGAANVIAASGPCHVCTRWSGTVGFDFANDWGNDATNDAMRTLIRKAIAHWEAVTGLEFEQRASGERVVFRNSMGCSSMVGRQVFTYFDPQMINLSIECDYGAIVHEIAHAIGLWHEQSRNDRDDYVTVNIDAIREDRRYNFDQFGGSGLNWGEYDFRSIMHYRCTDFKLAGATVDPIVPIAGGVTCADLGQRDSLSTGDISGAYRLYLPQFSIVGASPGDVSDRFELALAFDSKPVRDEYIRWGAAGLGFQGTGPTFSTLDAGLPDDTYEIYAEIWIANERIARRSIELTIRNTPPVVDLGPTRDVQLNRCSACSPTSPTSRTARVR
jgi:hypothetical protein